MNKGTGPTSPIVTHSNHSSVRLEINNYVFSVHVFSWDF